MAVRTLQVMCINKWPHRDPHERILAIGGVVGGVRWKHSEDQAIANIESGEVQYYTSVGGRTARVIIAMHFGRKYLKTTADSYSPDNLLSLEECPK
jgi:hypothetical protein